MHTPPSGKEKNKTIIKSFSPQALIVSIAIGKATFNLVRKHLSPFSVFTVSIFGLLMSGMILFPSWQKDEYLPVINAASIDTGMIKSTALTYYIDPMGNDISGNGSLRTPWKSLYKASVNVMRSGSTIHINAGTYIEPKVCYFNDGVSVVGSGSDNTLIQIANTGVKTSMGVFSLLFQDGNYASKPVTVSDITFDGIMTSQKGIYIYHKHDFVIRDCSFVNFVVSAVHFQGASSGIFNLRNKFYNNNVSNCSELREGGSPGAVEFYSTQNTECYNNIITVGKRDSVSGGFGIKINYIKGDKIHDNTIIVEDNDDGDTWAFAIEYWNAQGGSELYNNVIRGVIDITGGVFTPGIYSFQHWIHDNEIGFTTLQSQYRHGMYIEGNTRYTKIENNTFSNLLKCISFYTNSEHASGDITIQKNIFSNIGSLRPGGYGYGIMQAGSNGFTISNLFIYNNVFKANPLSRSEVTSAIQLPYGSGSTTNVNIKNNIIQGFFHAPIRTIARGSGTNILDILNIQNNDFFQNGDGNVPVWSGAKPSNLTMSDNLTKNPIFISASDFHLQSNSPLKSAGIDVGLPFKGNAPDIGAFEH